MTTLDISKATESLADYSKDVSTEPLILTKNGLPVAALVSIEDMDWESLSLILNSKFIDIIEKSRQQIRAKGGVSAAEMGKRLALDT